MGLGIAGSGAIACGLARIAGERMPTSLWARSDASARRASELLGDSVRIVTELEQIAQSTIIVEAIAEEQGAKCDLYARLNAIAGPQTLFASTTSALPVAELAAASGRPDRFAALHVFNPVHKMELVELSFPDDASPETREAFRALCSDLGKTAVEVPDTPGFIVNRLLFPMTFAAVELMEQTGLEPAAIDTAMKLGAGHPVGPLALLDFVGLDVSAAIGRTLEIKLPRTLLEHIDAGRLGRKTGAGFYTYA